ncbi:MAG TPA: TM2 domain-containing protein, partial [Adhaeribacter sp.]|nr:TM2 domain-containing protein [Adhaeribacter sp.]
GLNIGSGSKIYFSIFMKIFSFFFFLVTTFVFAACTQKPFFAPVPGTYGAYHQPTAETQQNQQPEPVIFASADKAIPVAIPAVAATPVKSISIKPKKSAPKQITIDSEAAETFAIVPPVKPGKPLKARTRTRNQTLAIILAAPPLGMLGLHRIYLGYYLVGILQLGLTAAGIFIGPAPLLILAFCWIITDLVRIIKRVLQPKDGRYK